jgi:zinc-ribbon domain
VRPVTPVAEARGTAPKVLEGLDELEQRRSIQPLVVPGPAVEPCPRCGSELRVGWEFCPHCGAPGQGTPSRPRRRFFTQS